MRIHTLKCVISKPFEIKLMFYRCSIWWKICPCDIIEFRIFCRVQILNRGLIDNLVSLKYFISRLNFIVELGWNFRMAKIFSSKIFDDFLIFKKPWSKTFFYFLVITISWNSKNLRGKDEWRDNDFVPIWSNQNLTLVLPRFDVFYPTNIPRKM